MKRIAQILVLSLFFFASVNMAYGQLTGTITINGDLNKYYPVTFYDGGWYADDATELEIGRSDVHRDEDNSGSMIARFRYHVSNWGHGSQFIDAEIQQYVNPTSTANNRFVGGWRDGSYNNSTRRIIIWLRGSTTYAYSSNYPVTPAVYDDVQNVLPYSEPGGQSNYHKVVVDAYVNSYGISYSTTAYFNGPSINYYAGSVGIGTTAPGAYKLAVEGIIGARKVKVTQGGWADFVFEPGYKLPSLWEVESYVAVHKHLPGVPGAAEVEKEGLDVGEMQKVQMQKIEELMLYMIELKKENEMLRRRMVTLEENQHCEPR